MAAQLALGVSMLTNYHFHSRCSFDAEHSLKEMVSAGLRSGITRFCLTDHCDLINDRGQVDDSFSWEKEDRELLEARKAFPEADIRRGIELGQAILRRSAAEKILSEPGIDFVLGSMHNCRTGIDYYWIEYESLDQCYALMEDYLQCLLELSRTDYFDSLAHLTYVQRYMRSKGGFPVEFTRYYDLIREILKTLIHRGKALELNTSGYENNGGEPLPNEAILRMYRELGGELITIGSDAHTPDKMALGLEKGMALLRNCGFRYLTLYKERKPQQILL